MDDGTYEPARAPRALNPLEVTGQVLVAAATLMIIGGVLYAWAFETAGWRDRLEILSSYGASVITGVIVLGAILALVGSRSDRIEPYAVAAQIVAGLVVLLSLASSLSTLTQSSTEESFVSGGIGRSEWPTKLSVVLPHIAAALIGGIVLLIANQKSDP
jgi:ABC-type sulfate transport system permease component